MQPDFTFLISLIQQFVIGRFTARVYPLLRIFILGLSQVSWLIN